MFEFIFFFIFIIIIISVLILNIKQRKVIKNKPINTRDVDIVNVVSINKELEDLIHRLEKQDNILKQYRNK